MIEKFKKNKNIFLIFFLVILVIGLVSALVLVKQKQDIRRQAETGGVDLSFLPIEAKVLKGDEFDLDIYINTNSLEVSAISFLISIDPSSFEFVNFLPTSVLPVELSEGKLEFGKVSLAIGADCNADGCYPFSGSAKIATIRLKAINSGSHSIDFAGTEVASVSNESDTSGTLGSASILVEEFQAEPIASSIPTSSPASLFIEEPTKSPISTPTEYPSPQPSKSPIPTPSESPTATPTATSTSSPTIEPELPDAGVSYPTVLGVIIGTLSIIFSLLIIF